MDERTEWPDSLKRLSAFAREVVRVLDKAGHRALWAGGCVRDRLLGRTPKDIDVATSATPDEVAALFARTVMVGASFGVVRVLENPAPKDRQAMEVEVATFRTESGYSDGRHPDRVAFADEVADVKRRDFTVNGMLYDPIRDEVVDHVGGRRDLKAGILRAIGNPDERFGEDRLRLIRAVRFAAELDFEIESETWKALKKNAEKISSVSNERVRDELLKMLRGRAPRRAMELLREAGLLRVILPEIEALVGVEQPPRFHPEGDVWEHTLQLLQRLERPSVSLAMAALLHDVGKPTTLVMDGDRQRFNEHEKVGAEMAEAIMRRLRFSNEQIERVRDLIARHMAFKDVKKMRPAKLKRFLRQPYFHEHLELHRLDCEASHGKLDCHRFCCDALKRLSSEPLRPAPLLSGHDLKALGFKPGPRFRQILEDVEDRQLEGVLKCREEAIGYVIQRFVP